MTRFFMIILLLTVFFLSGMLFGINQESSDSLTQSQKVESALDDRIHVNDENNKKETKDEKYFKNEKKPEDASQPTALTITQKAASLLEIGIKGFYEIIVGILYQIALLFF